MSMRFLGFWLLALATIGLSGCRRNAAPTGLVEDPDNHLPEATEVAIADWLTLSRPELDQKFEDWKSTASKLLDVARGDRQSVLLLPKLRPVLTLPVFQDARFSPRVGLSLPPYADDGGKDAALAIHLARFGDADGALLLTDPADAALRKEIEALRPGRNYPVEWTRLVALAQFVGELRTARDDRVGAASLIHLHEQLRIVLDPKAAAGPLGSTLLAGGRRALEQAEVAWDEAKKTGFSGDVKSALAAWGEVPPPVPALVPGASRQALERVFPPFGKSHAVTALGAANARAFDLLSVPLPVEEMEGITAFLDAQDKLSQFAFLYRPRASQTYPDPAYVAQRLASYGVNGQDAPTVHGTFHQVFASNDLNYDVTLIPRGSTFGALVRVFDSKGVVAPSFLPPDPRDFGAVHFDRTFDQNRLAVAPEQRSTELVTVTKGAELERVAPPGAERGRTVSLPAAASLQLKRLEGYDLLSALAFRWDRGENATALDLLAVPLWAAYGAPRFEPEEDLSGGHLSLIWEDATMRYTLRLPHDEDQPPEFSAEDKRGATGASEREKLALTFDRDQRTARLAAGKPLQRVPRAFDEASTVKLGMPRTEVEAALPASQSLRKSAIERGWSVIFLNPTAGLAAATPQQLLVRIGPDEKVAELRLRYNERFVPKGDKTPTLLSRLSSFSGAPEIGTPTWTNLWNDLPPQKPSPVLYRWKDDTTVMTLQRDAGGAEVILSERPTDPPVAVESAPLQFVSRGAIGYSLGDSRASIVEQSKISDPTKVANDGIVLPAPKSSPYENIVVFFANDKADRIVAYHRPKNNFQASEVPLALQESWGRDIDHLGAVRRQEIPAGPVLGGFGWHDDVTRVRTFANDTDQGPRLYTEWREWAPGPAAKGVAAAR